MNLGKVSFETFHNGNEVENQWILMPIPAKNFYDTKNMLIFYSTKFIKVVQT